MQTPWEFGTEGSNQKSQNRLDWKWRKRPHNYYSDFLTETSKMALVNTKDHWSFLEEIEAPMWVDFTVEAKSNYQDIDDKWFHTSHPFHQCSSLQLKALFAHSCERSVSSGFDFEGPSSPNLPSSVSRSRGKQFASRKWEGDNGDLCWNKQQQQQQHPIKVLKGNPTRMNSVPGNDIKPKLSFVNSKGPSRSQASMVSEGNQISKDDEIKTKLSFVNSKGNSMSRVGVVSDRSITQNSKETDLKAKSSHAGSESILSSRVIQLGESNTSTVTFESEQHAQKGNLQGQSLGLDHTSGLLCAVRNGLRKSFVTRKASRVEVNNDTKQLREHKSSSSKSSVGSSMNPGYDVKSSASMQNKDLTPDSRNVARMTEATKNKVKDLCKSKTSNVQVKKRVSTSRMGGGSTVAKSAPQETAKSKVQVQNQILCTKTLVQRRGNELDSLTSTGKSKEKVRLGGNNRSVGIGKENTVVRMSESQKCSSRGTKQNVLQKGGETVSIRNKGKTCSPSKGKHLTNVTQSVYFR